MKFKISTLLILLAFTSSLYAQKYQIIVGSYTTDAKPEGIFVYDFSPADPKGRISWLERAVDQA